MVNARRTEDEGQVGRVRPTTAQIDRFLMIHEQVVLYLFNVFFFMAFRGGTESKLFDSMSNFMSLAGDSSRVMCIMAIIATYEFLGFLLLPITIEINWHISVVSSGVLGWVALHVSRAIDAVTLVLVATVVALMG